MIIVNCPDHPGYTGYTRLIIKCKACEALRELRLCIEGCQTLLHTDTAPTSMVYQLPRLEVRGGE
jgi:hypothetical protein